MSSSSPSSFYAYAGDFANLLAVTNALVFGWSVIRFINDDSNHFFDEQWKQDGFCVTNKDIEYWSSHDVCLYADTIYTMILGLAYWALSKNANMQAANQILWANIPGTLAHGIGHGLVAMHMRSDGTSSQDDMSKVGYEILREQNAFEMLSYQVPGFLFWMGLMKTVMPDFPWSSVAVAASLAQGVGMMIPQQLGFTYVQTALALTFACSQFVRSKRDKGFEYATYPAIVGLPVTLVAWLESTQCTKFVRDRFYGHVVYDSSIVLFTLLWYFLCAIHASSVQKPKTS